MGDAAAGGDEAARRPARVMGRDKPYKGIRMRKWGKWVAEVREPNKRSRIWLGSYSTPVAAARAYDTAVFYLRGPSARLNFPEFVVAAAGVAPGEEDVSAAFIRKKATEVGESVDAALGHGVVNGAGIGIGNDMCVDGDGDGDDESNDNKGSCCGEILLRVDLNEMPVPEESDGDSEKVKDKIIKKK